MKRSGGSSVRLQQLSQRSSLAGLNGSTVFSVAYGRQTGRRYRLYHLDRIEVILTPYAAVLFVHAVAVLTLTAGIAIETWMLYQMRRTPSLYEARLWVGAVPGLNVTGIVSLAIVLVTGAYLTAHLSAWAFAWPKLAVVGVLLFALLGGLT